MEKYPKYFFVINYIPEKYVNRLLEDDYENTVDIFENIFGSLTDHL